MLEADREMLPHLRSIALDNNIWKENLKEHLPLILFQTIGVEGKAMLDIITCNNDV